MARRGRKGKDEAGQPQDEQPQDGSQSQDGEATPEEPVFAGDVPRAPEAQPELPLGQQPISWTDLSRIFTDLEEASSEVEDLKEQLKQAKGRQAELKNELTAAGRRVRFAALEHAAEDTKRDLERIAELQRQDLDNAAKANEAKEAQARQIRTRALRNRVVLPEEVDGPDPMAPIAEAEGAPPPPPPAAPQDDAPEEEEHRTEETDAA